MVTYKFAFKENGSTVTANEIAGKPVLENYWCIGCGNPLIAKVNGKVYSPHFSHKVQVECSGEKYLHRLGKAVFVETYKKCLESDLPFTIKLRAAKTCRKFSPIIMRDCNLGEVEKEYDLTNYYQEIYEEKKAGEFIPDVLLVSKKNPNEKIFIEIACTHFLSEKKEQSANRIIEIPIDSEDDIEKIKNASLSPRDALFIGFSHNSESVTDSECYCAGHKYYGFYVTQGGKALLEFNKLMAIYSNICNNKSKLLYSNVFPSKRIETDGIFDYGEARGLLFIEQVRLAARKNIAIRNCYICRYHGNNWDTTIEHSIFCKTFKKTCTSNEAANCERYKIEPEYLNATTEKLD